MHDDALSFQLKVGRGVAKVCLRSSTLIVDVALEPFHPLVNVVNAIACIARLL